MRTWIKLLALIVCATGANTHAQPERYLDSLTGWGYLYGATTTQVNAQNGAGSRVINLERVGTTNTYDMVVVDNTSGPFAATGTVVVYNQTLTQLSNYLTNNNRRILDVEVDENAGAERFTAVTVPNSGATAAPGWGWLIRVNAQQIADWLAQNPNLRLIDIERYTLGGTPFYTVVAIPNTGANFRPWNYALNRTASEITALLSAGSGSCIIDIELESPGTVLTSPRFNVIYVNSPPGAALWWYPSLTSDQVNDLVAQNGARLVTFHRWTTWTGATRWAVSMMDNSNAESRRLRGILANRNSGGVYGFKLKRVGGNVLAVLNEDYVFEPASTLKIAHAAALVRRASLGLEDYEEVQNYSNPCDSDACPTQHFCTTGPQRTLGYILERMLRVSDNTATRYIRVLLDGGGSAFSGVNSFIASQGLSSNTVVNHDIGCFAPTNGVPFNGLTARDAVLLYERISNGSIFNADWRDDLFDQRMNNWPRDRNSSLSTYQQLRQILDEEMNATNLQPNEREDFLDAFRVAFKRGGYGWGTKTFPDAFWRSTAGWAQFPHITVINNLRVTSQRQYAYVMYQDWASNDDGAILVYRDVMELLRTPIRDALQSWDDACTSPTAAAVQTTVSVPQGQQTTLSVLAGGAAHQRAFQWFRFNTTLATWLPVTDFPGSYSGAQTATLTVFNATPQNAGLFRCRVTNYCGTTNSNSITLVVTASCPGDTNGDGVINFTDLNAVLTQFGQSVAPGSGGDVTGDGVVNFSDLNEVLSNFGNTCN